MRALRSSALFFFLAFLLSWYPYLLEKTHLVHTSGGINPLGPAVAALIVAGIFYRGRGVKELLARYLPWRAHWSNYAIALALPGACRPGGCDKYAAWSAPGRFNSGQSMAGFAAAFCFRVSFRRFGRRDGLARLRIAGAAEELFAP